MFFFSVIRFYSKKINVFQQIIAFKSRARTIISANNYHYVLKQGIRQQKI